MPFNFNKKKKPTPPIDNSSSDNTSSTPDSTQSASDNSKFRKELAIAGNSIKSGAKSMANGARRVHNKFIDFNTFCGGCSIADHRWLKKYYKKFGGDSEKAIDEIISDERDIATIRFQSGHMGEYHKKSGKILDRPFSWNANINYDYTPPKEEAKASQDDSAQAEYEDGQCIVVVPRGYRVSRGRIRKGGQTERKEGSDR